jgi:hypothetical protein
MPNWCENDLMIAGNTADVQQVLDFIKSGEGEDQTLFDFSKIIPYPEKYVELDKKANDFGKEANSISRDDPDREKKLSVIRSKYGVHDGEWLKDGYNSGGYEWCCEIGEPSGTLAILQ